MQTLATRAESAKITTTLTIKGITYTASPIDPIEEGTAAYRLVKATGEVYDVVRTHQGILRCDCPSYVVTHEGGAGTCKHGTALVKAGLLKAPTPVGYRGSQPVTRQDRVRASYWGLTIPKAVPPVIVAPIVQEAPQAPPVADPGFAERVVGFLTDSALDLIEDDETRSEVQADRIYDTLDDENKTIVDGFLASINLPGATWHQWLTLCRTGTLVYFPPTAVADDEPEARASWPRRSRPSESDEAFHAGFGLALDGEDPRAPQGWSYPRLLAFYEGVQAGKVRLARDEILEREAWLAIVEASHPARFEDACEGERMLSGAASGHPSFEG